MLSPEEIVENFERYKSFFEKVSESRREDALRIIDYFSDRLATCPASGRLEHHNAFPGGLVEHSINVLKNALSLRKMLNASNVSIESLVICCLFHDLGKVGDIDNDYYIPQDSDWHRDKCGEMFKINKDLLFMTVPHRSIWICNYFNFALTQEEFIAIMIHDGQYVNDNSSYKMKEPQLADIVQMADFISTKQEKVNSK